MFTHTPFPCLHVHAYTHAHAHTRMRFAACRLLGFMERLNSIYSPVYPLISQLMSSLERNNTNGSHILYSHVKLGSGMLPFAYQTSEFAACVCMCIWLTHARRSHTPCTPCTAVPTSYYVKENLAADFAEFLCMEFAGVYTAQELMNFCQFVENLKTPELWSEHLRLAGVFMAEAMNGR